MVLRGPILPALCSSSLPQHFAQGWRRVDPVANEQKALSLADPKTQQRRGPGAYDMGQVPGSKWASAERSVTHSWDPSPVRCSLQSPCLRLSNEWKVRAQERPKKWSMSCVTPEGKAFERELMKCGQKEKKWHLKKQRERKLRSYTSRNFIYINTKIYPEE